MAEWTDLCEAAGEACAALGLCGPAPVVAPVPSDLIPQGALHEFVGCVDAVAAAVAAPPGGRGAAGLVPLLEDARAAISDFLAVLRPPAGAGTTETDTDTDTDLFSLTRAALLRDPTDCGAAVQRFVEVARAASDRLAAAVLAVCGPPPASQATTVPVVSSQGSVRESPIVISDDERDAKRRRA